MMYIRFIYIIVGYTERKELGTKRHGFSVQNSRVRARTQQSRLRQEKSKRKTGLADRRTNGRFFFAFP